MKNFKKLTTLLLSLVLTISSVSYVYADENDTTNNDVEKQETVYAFLDANGNFKSATVSEWLHSDNGFNNVKDESILSDIKNLKGDEEIVKDGNNLTWNSNNTDIYYQGTTNKELPLSMQVTYYFNGSKVNVEDVVGQSGKLEVHIKLVNNQEKTEVINGKTRHISTLFPCVIITDLKTDMFEDVNADGAIIVNESKNQVVSFVTVSGASKLLKDSSITELNDIKDKLKDEFVIKANVTDFEMPSIYCAISGMMDLDEDNITASDLDELRNGINDLQDAMNEVLDGSNSLKSGASELESGINSAKDGANTLTSNDEKLKSGASKIENGLGQLYTSLTNEEATTKLQTLVAGSTQFKNALSTDSTNLTYAEFKTAVKTASAEKGSEIDVDTILSSNQTLISTLTSAMESADETTKGTYTQIIQVLTADSAIIGATDTYLQTAKSTLSDNYSQLDGGINELATNMGTITSGVNELYEGSKELSAGINDYTDGANKVKNGLDELSLGANKLTTGANDLNEGLNKFNNEGVSKLSTKVNDAINTLDDVVDVVNEVLDQSVEYNNYAGASSNMETSVKFIMKTEEVSAPEKEETTTEESTETTTFWQRLVNLFKK